MRARSLSRQILFYQCLQWVAGTQWERRVKPQSARGCALRRPSLHGRSAQRRRLVRAGGVRTRSSRSACRLTRSAQPDRTGACLPTTGRILRAERLPLARSAARRSAALYDGYPGRSPRRFLSHLLAPANRRGRAGVLARRSRSRSFAWANGCSNIFREAGIEIIAEDLGTVPTLSGRR